MEIEMATEQFQVLNRWTKPAIERQGTPRAKPIVRAKVVHTDAQKRRVEVFVGSPVADQLGWISGGAVQPEFRVTSDALLLRLTPTHKGLRATRSHATSGALRICIAGSPIGRGLCASVRPVAFEIEGASLVVTLPRDWVSAPVLEAAQ